MKELKTRIVETHEGFYIESEQLVPSPPTIKRRLGITFRIPNTPAKVWVPWTRHIEFMQVKILYPSLRQAEKYVIETHRKAQLKPIYHSVEPKLVVLGYLQPHDSFLFAGVVFRYLRRSDDDTILCEIGESEMVCRIGTCALVEPY